MSGFLAVLGGNDLAIPSIERMRAHGHRVLVVDGNAQAPARDLGDAFVHVNFSDVPATLAALSDQPLTGILPINDFGVRAASAVAAARGLPGNSAAAAYGATNKKAMREAWRRAGLPQPRFAAIGIAALLAGERADWNEFPCIAKPAFSGGGSRAVRMVGNWDEVVALVREERARFLDDEVIVEEFVAGSEHTVEVLMWPGGRALLSISDKENYPGSVTVVQNLYFPGPNGHARRAEIEPLVFAACDALGLSVGAAHFEVLVTPGGVVLLEVGSRPGGGPNLHPICALSTGRDYPALYAQVMTGRLPDLGAGPAVHLAWHYLPVGQGVVRAIEGLEAVRAHPQVIDCKVYERIGEPSLDIHDDLARPGYVMVKAATHAEARALADRLVDSISIDRQ